MNQGGGKGFVSCSGHFLGPKRAHDKQVSCCTPGGQFPPTKIQLFIARGARDFWPTSTVFCSIGDPPVLKDWFPHLKQDPLTRPRHTPAPPQNGLAPPPHQKTSSGFFQDLAPHTQTLSAEFLSGAVWTNSSEPWLSWNASVIDLELAKYSSIKLLTCPAEPWRLCTQCH